MHARCLFDECVCVLMCEGMSSILDGIRLALSILCKTGFGANQLVLADWLAGCCPESPGDPPVSVFLYVYCVDGTQVLKLAWQVL